MARKVLSPDVEVLPASITLGVGPNEEDAEADRDRDRPPGGCDPLGARATIAG